MCCWVVASRQNLLEDLAQDLSQKDESPQEKRLTHEMVWNEDLVHTGSLQLEHQGWRGKDQAGTVLLPYRKSQALFWGLLVPV